MIEHMKSNNTWDDKGKKKRVQDFVDVIMNSEVAAKVLFEEISKFFVYLNKFRYSK